MPSYTTRLTPQNGTPMPMVAASGRHTTRSITPFAMRVDGSSWMPAEIDPRIAMAPVQQNRVDATKPSLKLPRRSLPLNSPSSLACAQSPRRRTHLSRSMA